MGKLILRRLFRSPGFAAATLLTLAIGIGANTAVFSVIDGILLRPLPYPEPDRIVGLWQTSAKLNITELSICPSLYFTYREQGRAFEDVGAYTGGSVSITQIGRPERVQSLFVTDGVLPILGAAPALGRSFSRIDDTAGSPKTAILSYGYWQSHFGGDRAAIGRHMTVSGEDHEIIGVLPQSFRFMDPQPAIFLPLQFDRRKAVLGNFSQHGIARLKPGVTVAQANADVARMIPIWLTTFPAPPGFSPKIFEDARIGPNVRPFMRDVVGDIGGMLWVVMGTIGAVLLIACANVANLLLVRAEGRRHELAIRAALGAGRRRIAGELLMESMALGVVGGALGLAVAYGALRFLVYLAPAGLPRLGEVGIDPAAVLFTLAVSLASGALFGVLPVFKYAGIRAGTGLREGNRSVSGGRERHRARNVLVVVQVALALLLLIASGLMVRTVQAMARIDPGFTKPEEVLTLRISIPDGEVKDAWRAAHMEQDIMTRIAAIPSVEAVGTSNSITMDGQNSSDVLYAEDHPITEGKLPPVRRYKFVSPGYFGTIGQRFAAGRDLTWTDVYDNRLVTIVSENMAREYWGSPAAALGKRIREGAKEDWREIVGVVGDEHDDGVQEKAPAVAYWPYAMKSFYGEEPFVRRDMAFAIRSKRTGSVEFLAEIRKAAGAVAPNSPLESVRSLSEIYSRSMARTSFTLVMLGLSGGMALLLGLVGIYGVISYSVTQRRREIGIRVALGASGGSVSGMFVRHGFVLAAVGVVCGLGAALSMKKLIASLLFGVTAADPWTYAIVSGALVLAAMLASYIPSRRAAAVNPMETLRSE
jgi:predicted permease